MEGKNACEQRAPETLEKKKTKSGDWLKEKNKRRISKFMLVKKTNREGRRTKGSVTRGSEKERGKREANGRGATGEKARPGFRRKRRD